MNVSLLAALCLALLTSSPSLLLSDSLLGSRQSSSISVLKGCIDCRKQIEELIFSSRSQPTNQPTILPPSTTTTTTSSLPPSSRCVLSVLTMCCNIEPQSRMQQLLDLLMVLKMYNLNILVMYLYCSYYAACYIIRFNVIYFPSTSIDILPIIL